MMFLYKLKFRQLRMENYISREVTNCVEITGDRIYSLMHLIFFTKISWK